jgi:hypothetical protein
MTQGSGSGGKEPSLQWLEDGIFGFFRRIWPLLALIAVYMLYRIVVSA